MVLTSLTNSAMNCVSSPTTSCPYITEFIRSIKYLVRTMTLCFTLFAYFRWNALLGNKLMACHSGIQPCNLSDTKPSSLICRLRSCYTLRKLCPGDTLLLLLCFLTTQHLKDSIISQNTKLSITQDQFHLLTFVFVFFSKRLLAARR